ncbi:MAG: hypothetical protein AAF871_06745 [Pseudomonadota bacterium]
MTNAPASPQTLGDPHVAHAAMPEQDISGMQLDIDFNSIQLDDGTSRLPSKPVRYS